MKQHRQQVSQGLRQQLHIVSECVAAKQFPMAPMFYLHLPFSLLLLDRKWLVCNPQR